MLGLAGVLFGATGPGAGAAGAAAGADDVRWFPPPLGRGRPTVESGVVAWTLTSGMVTTAPALSATAVPGAIKAPSASAGHAPERTTDATR